MDIAKRGYTNAMEYTASVNGSSEYCVFCRIVEGSADCSQIYRDDVCIAFVCLHQVNPGHTLVCPTRHVESFTELSAEEATELMVVAQQIASVQKARMPGCSGATLSLADGVDAGQEVPHTHLHVIPRSLNDGFGWKRFGERPERTELDRIADLLRI